MVWVKGHYEPIDSENPYYTRLNIEADMLATGARERVADGTLIPAQHKLFPGMVAGICTKNNDIIQNNRKKIKQ